MAKKNKQGRDDVIFRGWNFTKSGNHWANLGTMKELMEEVIAPYFKAQKEKLKLPEEQVCVVLLDCWAVHRGAEFRAYMAEAHPSIRLLFVPACCTGKLQPLDLAVNKAIKDHVRTAAHMHLARLYMENRDKEGYKLPTSMRYLRTKIPWWLHEALERVSSSTIKNGFEKAGLMRAFDKDFQVRCGRVCRVCLLVIAALSFARERERHS